MNDWDGKERRHDDSKILILMTEIANDMKHMVKSFDSHLLDDQKTAAKVAEIEKTVTKWGGGLAVLLCVLGVFIKFVK